MNDDKDVKPRVFFARKDNEGKRFASGVWDDGTKVYIKNFRETNDGLIADVDYQTDEQYENKQGKMVYRHKICGALSLSSTKATMVIELNNVKERLTCEPRQANSKKTGEPLLILDFGNGASLNPYVDEVLTDEPNGAMNTSEQPKPIEVDSIEQLVDDTLPF